MALNIRRLVAPEAQSNVYLVRKGNFLPVLFDTGSPDGRWLLKILKQENIDLAAIFLTHGHFDHIGGLVSLSSLDVPTYLAIEDQEFLLDPEYNGSLYLGLPPLMIEATATDFLDGEVIECPKAGLKIKAIKTPFHTRGSSCFYLEEAKVLFTGDTLFRGSIGRDDLMGACPRFLSASLHKITSLKGETVIYPGHGAMSTLDFEKKNNPFLKNI